MSFPRTFRLATAALLAAATAPAWPQGFHHAPQTPYTGESLLPLIIPGKSSHARRSTKPVEPPSDDATEQPQPEPRALPTEPTPPLPEVATTAHQPSLPTVRPAPAKDRWFPIDAQGNPVARAARPSRPASPGQPAAPVPPPAETTWRTANIPETTWRVTTPPPAPAGLPRALPPESHMAQAAPAEPFVLTDPSASPETPLAARTLAAERLARGDAAGAEAILAAASARFPKDADAALALARLRESREDWTGAVAAYDAVLRNRPAEARWRLRRADCLYQAGDYAAALADYDQTVAADSNAFSLGDFARFGDAALRTDDPAKAEAAFTALARRADHPLPRVELLRGVAALKQGQAARARSILLQACARWPEDDTLTDALRLASATHYGDAPVVTAGRTEAPPTADSPAAKPAIVATAAENPSASATQATSETEAKAWRRASRPIGWRATRPAPVESPPPADGEPRLLPE